MKTAPHIERLRENHHKALESIAANKTPGLKLWRQLRMIEQQAHADATAYCNGEIDGDRWEMQRYKAFHAVVNVLGKVPEGLFINADARGYALKLDPERGAVIPEGMHKDWGGYGILAAEINED